MHVESVSIENFKTFFERQRFELEPGFNLLVGANNAGKTTVLDVLDLEPSLQNSHRSTRSIPRYGAAAVGNSRFEVAMRTDLAELRALCGPVLHLPIQPPNTNQSEADLKEALSTMFERDASLLLAFTFGNGRQEIYLEADPIVRGRFVPEVAQADFGAVIDFREIAGPVIGFERRDMRGSINPYPSSYRQRVYRFSAQRRPAAVSPPSSNVLEREGQNLPFCINHLQTNDAYGHRLLCEWVHRIFPNVRWVQAPPLNNQFAINCLPVMPEARREDLAVPMASMGSGIGNVLAMLYVVLTSRHPQLIAIDEPNAYLHPRALRELLNILAAEGRQHQFVLTAHSPDVLTAVNPKTIALLEFDGVATSVKQIGPTEIHKLRGGLAELGIRMTDLHAKDSVLWVEGQTEELVFPEILRWACPEVAAGTAVMRVERTGTFSTRKIDPTEVAFIYERLSHASALVPPMVCILLDGESMSAERRAAAELGSNGRLRYLPRRMLENYLLHPEAIAAALHANGETVGLEIVSSRLSVLLNTNTIEEVDGAQILATLFSELSDARQEFRKTRDVELLVSHLLETEPEFLRPLRDFLRGLFALAGLH
jgi:hypothetical protein